MYDGYRYSSDCHLRIAFRFTVSCNLDSVLLSSTAVLHVQQNCFYISDFENILLAPDSWKLITHNRVNYDTRFDATQNLSTTEERHLWMKNPTFTGNLTINETGLMDSAFDDLEPRANRSTSFKMTPSFAAQVDAVTRSVLSGKPVLDPDVNTVTAGTHRQNLLRAATSTSAPKPEASEGCANSECTRCKTDFTSKCVATAKVKKCHCEWNGGCLINVPTGKEGICHQSCGDNWHRMCLDMRGSPSYPYG
jgi:hypothetical protein